MYLGLICNQHSFTATVLSPDTGGIIHFDEVNFDNDLPHRETEGGVLRGDNTGEIFVDPQMLLEALELLLENLQDSKAVDISKITHITGSAYAASIFLHDEFDEALNNLNPNFSLTDQIRPCYTQRLSPTSSDTSAAPRAEQIKEQFQKNHTTEIRSLTGCPLTSGTMAAQIHKFNHIHEKSWEATSHVHVTSSFLLSILIGTHAPIDMTDTSQLCLFNIQNKSWIKDILDEVAPDAHSRLPAITESGSVVQHINTYFCSKYGFSDKTKCLSWLSPEATHALGTNLITPGQANLDLDKKYTFSLLTKTIPKEIPSLARVTFHPASGYLVQMSLENGFNSFLNIVEQLKIDDDDINNMLDAIPTNKNPPTLPFVKDEQDLLIPASKQKDISLLSFTTGQILHIRLYSQWIDVDISSISLTGRGASIKELRQLCSNIFQTNCDQIDDTNKEIKGLAILCDIEDDVSRKSIFDKYHQPAILAKNTPEPFMATIYNNHLNHYHQLLYNHINNKTTTL